MEVSEEFEELLVWLIDATDEIRELILLEVLAEGTQTVLHELIDLDGVMALVGAVDGEADRTDETTVTAIGIDADEGRVLAVWVAVVGLDELPEAFGEVLDVHLHRHKMYNFIMNNSFNCVIAIVTDKAIILIISVSILIILLD